jgi:hypothetical protein
MSLQQNANGPADGKTFGATPVVPSTQFGSFDSQEKDQPGSDPGSKQVPAPTFSPENG